MATISIQRIVADTFAAYLSSKIPGLAGKITVAYSDPGTPAPCLALKILPEALRFEASEPDERYAAEPDDGKVVVDIGQFVGHYTLQLYTVSPNERETYEQHILDAFLETEGAPGTIFLTTPALTVNGYVSLYAAEAKAVLVSDTWHEEMTFEAKRLTFLDVEIDFPALTAYSAVTLTSLQTALANLTQSITSTSDLDPGDWVEIQDDGTTSPAA